MQLQRKDTGVVKFRHAILNELTVAGRYRAIPANPLPIAEILQQLKAGGLNSRDQFQRLFFSFRVPSSTDLFCLEIFSEAIRASHLEVCNEFMSIPPKIDSSLRNIGEAKGRIVQSAEHQGMKIWVREFLHSKGISAARGEISQLGYKVDVGCLQKQVFIECGDTEPRKVLEFLRHNLTIGILQYDSEEIVWFKPGDSFLEFANSKTAGVLA